MIIGLSGYARSGKDESANALAGLGFRRVAFADKLREFLLTLNPVVIGGPVQSLRHVIDEYGWDGYKASPYGQDIRGLLQRLGTECGRELISDTIWINAALGEKSPGDGVNNLDNVVVTDVRFPNEAQAIKNRGGYVLRINRPGVGAANAHSSETGLDDWSFDGIVNNAGSIADLHKEVQAWALSFSVA